MTAGNPMADSHSLPPGQQLVARDKWPLVGEREPEPPQGEWMVDLTGAVRSPQRWSVEDLQKLPRVERAVDIHCVTRWSKLGVTFVGVRLSEVLQTADPLPEARFVSCVAYSARRHSTSLALDELIELDALVAWGTADGPLGTEHGGPVRMVVPGRYFYKSVKWLARIEVLAEDRLGYWEAEAGYHNHADPWREQRYLAADLDKRAAARLIQARDFTGQNLRSIDCRGRDLTGLTAEHALLRNADFRAATLTGANFAGANLSNAHFEGADLRGANFDSADLEGANLAGADLRGADFTGATVFGATFVGEHPAQLDAATRIDPAALEALTPDQAAFLRPLV